MTSSIVDMLPAELLVKVAEQTNQDDLAALRASCRAMGAATFNTYAEAFFVHRKHMWTAYSLETLAAISDNAALARHIKSIEFRFVNLDTIRHTENTSQVYWGKVMETIAAGKLLVEVEQVDVLKKFRGQEELLSGLDHGKQYLAHTFETLVKLGVSPAITFTGHAGRSLTSFFGFKALAAALGPLIDFKDFRGAERDS